MVLAWITCAKRPLETSELRSFLAIENGDTELDKDNRPDVKIIRSVCAGLVVIDEENDVIRLVHYTTQKYFEQNQDKFFESEKRILATACVTYLSFSVFESGFCKTAKELRERLEGNWGYEYIARNWGYHVREANMEDDKLTQRFLANHNKTSASSQVMILSNNLTETGEYPLSVLLRYRIAYGSGIHIAAWFGLNKLMGTLLENGHGVNTQASNGRTALSWAAERGHQTTVQCLLAREDIDPNLMTTDKFAKDDYHSHKRNDDEVITFVLDDETSNMHLASPLWYAARNGHDRIVEGLLSDPRVDPNLRDSQFGVTPLWVAVGRGHERVVKLLLEKENIDINSTVHGGKVMPLLHLAASREHPRMVELLLARKDIDPNLGDKDSDTPLMAATEEGHNEVVKLLLAHPRVDPNSQTKGIDPNLKNRGGHTALHLAITMRNDVAVELLLAVGNIDLNATNNAGETPLILAARQGSWYWYWNKRHTRYKYTGANMLTIRNLLHKGARPDVKDKIGRTPLYYAAMSESPGALNILIEDKRVEVDPKDYYGSTPLSMAVRFGREVSVELLLATEKVDINSKDNFGRTLLWWAARYEHYSISNLLQDYARRKSVLIPDIEMPTKKVWESMDFYTYPYCGVCMIRIPHKVHYWQCSSRHIEFDNFSMCTDCFEIGARCFDSNHEMERLPNLG